MNKLLFAIILLTIILLTITQNIYCQKKLDPQYLKELYKYCKNPDIVDIEKNEDYIEIDYLCNGKLYELVIDKISDAVSLETSSELSSITIPMKKKLEKNYPGWVIDECNQVKINNNTLYKIEIIKDGIEQNVYFTSDGKLYKSKNFLSSDIWNSSILKTNKKYSDFHYNLIEPTQTYYLPEVLREISGISIKSKDTIFCIQDELGVVYQYNLINEKIDKIYRFTDVGDFEDVTHIKDYLYILRSDGALFTFNLNDFPNDIKFRYLPFQSLNIEGLSNDNNDLIFACKETNTNELQDIKSIYSYPKNLENNKLQQMFIVSVDTINKLIKKHFPELKHSSIKFSPSAIAVHPITKDYYVLSASDRLLAIFDSNYFLKETYPLASDIFYKPEGIDFFQNGDMLISNEGSKNGLIEPDILLFKYRNN